MDNKRCDHGGFIRVRPGRRMRCILCGYELDISGDDDMTSIWTLDANGNPIPCKDRKDLEALMANDELRRIAFDKIGETTISTVFLIIDHRHTANGPPILFETMIFGGRHDQYQERYVTRAEAIEGHQRAVEMVSSPWCDA